MSDEAKPDLDRAAVELRIEEEMVERFVEAADHQALFLNRRAAQAFMDAAFHELGHSESCCCGECVWVLRKARKMIAGVLKL